MWKHTYTDETYDDDDDEGKDSDALFVLLQ